MKMEKIVTNKQETLEFKQTGKDVWRVYMLKNHPLYNQFSEHEEKPEGGELCTDNPESMMGWNGWISDGVELSAKSYVGNSVVVCNLESNSKFLIINSYINLSSILSCGCIKDSRIECCNIVLSSSESSLYLENFSCDVGSIGFNFMSEANGISLCIRDSSLKYGCKLDIDLEDTGGSSHRVLLSDVVFSGKTFMNTMGVELHNVKVDATGYLNINGKMENKVIDNEWKTRGKKDGTGSL